MTKSRSADLEVTKKPHLGAPNSAFSLKRETFPMRVGIAENYKKIQYVSNCTLGYILVSHGVGTYLSYKNQKFSAPNKVIARATKKSSVYPAAHKRQ